MLTKQCTVLSTKELQLV